jgi:hypothetical protein
MTNGSSSNAGGPLSHQLNAQTGNFLSNPTAFDNKFFNISPREARNMDPQQRILLHSAYEALEERGLCSRCYQCFKRDGFGCYIGVATDDYVFNLRDEVDVYYSTGTWDPVLFSVAMMAICAPRYSAIFFEWSDLVCDAMERTIRCSRYSLFFLACRDISSLPRFAEQGLQCCTCGWCQRHHKSRCTSSNMYEPPFC